jgi:hypothetical protein
MLSCYHAIILLSLYHITYYNLRVFSSRLYCTHQGVALSALKVLYSSRFTALYSYQNYLIILLLLQLNFVCLMLSVNATFHVLLFMLHSHVLHVKRIALLTQR